MNKKIKFAFFFLLFLGVVTIGLLVFFVEDIAVLSPKGLIGQKQNRLLLIATILMLIVVLPTYFLTFFISWKYRESNKKAKYTPDWDHSLLAESVWWGIPFIIIVVLGYFTWKGCHELDPFKPLVTNTKPVKIQVVALQWKWLFIYPEENIATVNFFQFPENTPVNFEITSDAPMNSFWIPRLGGQVYAMPGMRSKLYLIADEAGEYRGSSANLSGSGFAGMTFVAKSSSKADYDRWVKSVQDSSKFLTFHEYDKLFEPSEYQPSAFYVLREPGLFDWVVMKYMMPGQRMEHVH